MYEPPQNKNSSWTPSTVQKKGKSPSKLGHFSIQPKPNPSSTSSQEIGEYSRDSADRLTANVMRGIQAKKQEEAEGSTLQPKFESPWAPTFEPPPPLPESPASKLKGAFAPVSKNPIQRQCAECAKEEEEQKGEERKDVEEIGIQTKLTVGAPGDSYEQEADRVASQVMSMSAPADSSASVQRQLDTNHPHHPHQIWQRAQSIKPVMQRQIDPRVQMREMIQRAHLIDGNQASGNFALASGEIYEEAGRQTTHITSMPDNTPQVQRDTPTNVAIGSSAQGISVSLNVEPSKEIPVKYAKVKYSFPAGVKAKLQSKNKNPANIEVESKSDGTLEAKTSAVVYQKQKEKAKTAGESNFAALAYEIINPVDFEIKSVELENKLGTQNDNTSVATAIKLNFKNGQSKTVEVSLFELAAKDGINGPKITLERTFKFPDPILWENDNVQLVVEGDIKAKIEIKPNWIQIIAEYSKKKAFRTIIKNITRATMRGAVRSTARMFLLNPFTAGALITLGAAYMEIQSISDIADCEEKALEAWEGYVHGYCLSWGIKKYGYGGSKKWLYKGMEDGSTRLDEQIRKILNEPRFAPYNFTYKDLRFELKEEIKYYHAAKVYEMVSLEVKKKIFKEHIIKFYKDQNESFFSSYNARSNTRYAAYRLGIYDLEDILPVEE